MQCIAEIIITRILVILAIILVAWKIYPSSKEIYYVSLLFVGYIIFEMIKPINLGFTLAPFSYAYRNYQK